MPAVADVRTLRKATIKAVAVAVVEVGLPPRMATTRADGEAAPLVGGLERLEWDDPDDRNPLSGTRAGSKVRQVLGYRVADVVRELHRRNPRQVTLEHMDAAGRYLTDSELAGGSMGGWQPERLASSPMWLRSPSQVQIDAELRLRGARHAVGRMGAKCLDAVVLRNVTVSAWSDAEGVRDEVGKGFFLGCIQRLAEHYGLV